MKAPARFPSSIPLVVRNVSVCGPKRSLQVDMVFDTGADITLLSWSVLRFLGYDPVVSRLRRRISTANGIIVVPLLRIESIAVRGATASKVEVIAHDIPELAETQGLLGLSFLKHFRTIIDYKKGYVEIY